MVRALYYLLEVYVGVGSAGTPTLYDPSLGEQGWGRRGAHAGRRLGARGALPVLPG